MAQLLADIEAFLAATAKSPTAFGDEALSDRHFVRQLRAGRRVWPETEKKVREYMARASTPCDTCTRASATDVAACTAVGCPMRHVELQAEAA